MLGPVTKGLVEDRGEREREECRAEEVGKEDVDIEGKRREDEKGLGRVGEEGLRC